LLAQVQQSAACNALHEAEARFCRWLLQSRDRSDSDVVPITQEFVAQMLGVRRTTVTLVAQSLQDAGLLRYRRGQIEILDRDTLEARACECYGVVRRAIEQYLPPAGP
jgi:CRP-like cAMP-binding protein